MSFALAPATELDLAFAEACDASRRCVPSPERLAGLTTWLRERTEAHAMRVHEIPLAECRRWRFHETTGDLVHDSGRFFRVAGCAPARGREAHPIIVQPEVGLLGWLAQDRDGVMQFYCQAKVEPGNPGGRAQVSTTVQATQSNRDRVHGGRAVAFAEHFDFADERVIVDVAATEHADRFWRKVNRNVVRWCRPTEALPESPDYRWLTLGDLGALLRRDEVVHMDARSVLSCMPTAASAGSLAGLDDWRAACAESAATLPAHDGPLSRWLTRACLAAVHQAELCSLFQAMPAWSGGEASSWGSVIGLRVEAPHREVPAWDQPILSRVPRRHRLVTQRQDDGLRVAVTIRPEPGAPHGAEVGVTDTVPLSWADGTSWETRVRVRQSEEGGRFRESHEWQIAEAMGGDQVILEPGMRWCTLGELRALVRRGWAVDVTLRGMLACLW